ncbi:oxidoreductase [Lentithecium fluviatile CBS 122367]|uniref:Oxidoreductase n=1 Tax=Lentithecium fluviatile CBS 122367 TaxID=1168545 RepID=A0A6G1J808_9PLEO|nr:oxidoreductase [Lentithecium fluviatile CBS 122367]
MEPLLWWLLATLLYLTPSTTAHPSVSSNPQSPLPSLSWSLVLTNSTQQLRGLAPLSDKVAWVSGPNATVLRTIDAGRTWADVSPALAAWENRADYQFRDVHAWSAKAAVVLSIGEGNASRIYRTQDGGKTWERTFVNDEPTAFFDCLAFEEGGYGRHGLALSDPVNGRFRLIESWDWGKSWKLVDPEGMPPALEGEFAFAASGSCIEAKAGRWYIGSGGVDPGRIFRSHDSGKNWQVANSSIAGGAAAGVFSVRFRDAKTGVAIGGDYEKPTGNTKNAAWSRDGGASWHVAERLPGGYRSGVSWVAGRRDVAVAVGTSGSDITVDGGKRWYGIDNGSFDAVECVGWYGYSMGARGCWASGAKGKVAWLDLGRL